MSDYDQPESDSPAFGFVVGMALGLLIWAVVGLGVWWWTR